MATRSMIGVELPRGNVKAIYCHWDGYPEGVGADLLAMEFTNTQDVEAWIDEGHRSTVQESYADMRGELSTPNYYRTVSDYFNSDLHEWGYLYTQDRIWIVKDMHNNTDPIPVEEYKTPKEA
jgi:hypothetical protein